ncbi:TPA: succinylglutamate desuccinylase/aspartoacylase family protein [Legionella pneumophila]|uniref:succinylglutamate desuccinylase/aspartoacylase family protein n=1 Tax=Legionella pneumophila TaxID=446 RepID=UPI00077094A6|nr:succinylglutamate desuccinylase/aspartoacylase family protein [Legionella pneumophila]CZP46397.1 ectoine utilization protein EutE [Legionella pneumophila]HEH5967061.1 succinylglutamate desuccinylase/aspartoacylase family protein [Legionella pneumophila]HEL8431302.1 succinylglutamate desuccinylase/aspartoacylase family protein [Legionella pneumophila]HEL8483542.1 succinylglutamate desuccinylase/aspartoacylase family protein [Legionella pneumophila]HEL9672966.1 succinylglutamate desuccinylase
MKNSNLTICDATIHPGEIANLALPLPELYSCTSFFMPIKVVRGKQAGPCVLVFSALKGDELNGLEIINRLLEPGRLQNLKGTLIAIPVLNVLSLFSHLKTLSYEIHLERCFPGKADGTYGERIAHIFTKEILTKADYCIELQSGAINHDILPQIYCNIADAQCKTLARHFAAPVITNTPVKSNSLRKTTEKLNIPLLIYQAGEALRFNESAINVGLNGIYRILHALDMLHTAPELLSDSFKSIFSEDQDWIYSHKSGVLTSKVELGQLIHKKQVIGFINDPFGAGSPETIKSPSDGVVVGINRHPLIYEGQSIFKIASFLDNNRAETVIEAWGEQYNEK